MFKNIPIISLSRKRIERLSDMMGDIGVVFVASVVIPSLFDKPSILNGLSGIISALTFCIISLYLSDYKK